MNPMFTNRSSIYTELRYNSWILHKNTKHFPEFFRNNSRLLWVLKLLPYKIRFTYIFDKHKIEQLRFYLFHSVKSTSSSSRSTFTYIVTNVIRITFPSHPCLSDFYFQGSILSFCMKATGPGKVIIIMVARDVWRIFDKKLIDDPDFPIWNHLEGVFFGTSNKWALNLFSSDGNWWRTKTV